MELLLSSAFDQLSSSDPSLVRRGLRHIEGLLAQLCRPINSSGGEDDNTQLKDKTSAIDTRVADDPAYREFLRLQDGFEWNVCLRLLSCLEKLLGQENNELSSILIVSALEILQGVLLIHRPSRRVFVREVHMTILIDLLDSQLPASVQGATVSALVCALVEEWQNIRTFESLEGLATICTLFKRKSTDKEVKLKILEFLFFYLIPEPQNATPVHIKGSANSVSSSITITPSNVDNDSESVLYTNLQVRTTEEKQKMLSKYLSNVDTLVNELKQSQPFGNLMV
ncbi:cell division protein Cdc14 [Myxozyma melibiosi]|uniref:Cell division protein Cdc14 n=1 Tax=Myxozyma melibiosi TaxID=54550 RepID=A0ABR1F0G0_9ASCO